MVDVGDVLHGTYRIIRQIGSGGMGMVFIAEHLRLPKEVAIKVLRRDRSSDPQAIGRFRREAELCSRLGHANIVEVLDFNVLDDGSPYLVMELLLGESLHQRLKRVGALPLEEVLRIAHEVADGLAAVHALGIVHRDLKPENLFLCCRGDREGVKVLDFGISKILGSMSMNTRSDSVFGTPGYMSPEQAQGELQRIDARTDQFALAAILYEALAGRPAFMAEGDTPFSVLFKVVHAQPLPLFGVPETVSTAILRGLAKEPEARFADMAELSAALAGAPTKPAVVAGVPTPKRRRAGWIATAVIGLIALGGGATLWRPRLQSRAPAAAPVAVVPNNIDAAVPLAAAPAVSADGGVARSPTELASGAVPMEQPPPALNAAPVQESEPKRPARGRLLTPPKPTRAKPAEPRVQSKPRPQDDLVDPYQRNGK